MPITTIRYRLQRYPGFVYGPVQFEERPQRLALSVEIYPHAASRPRCARCGRRGPLYDRLAARPFEFLLLWGLQVFFWYMMRRVDCPQCGVTVERVPWAEGKEPMRTTSRWLLAHWARRLSWQEVAAAFHTSRTQVYRAVTTRARWILLHSRRHRRGKDRRRLRDLVPRNLEAVRAMLLRVDFQRFWAYRSVTWAAKWLDSWCATVLASQIEPMKTVARSLSRHRELLLNWIRLRGQYSSGVVEGLNNKAKLTCRRAYGFRSYKCPEIALYHTLGNLPEPNTTHRFY